MSSYRMKTYEICKKILDPKYKWLTYRHAASPYPEFRLPEDPTEDIENALSLKADVDKNSVGMDGGECWAAAEFKDNGFKVYSTNVNVLRSLRKDWPEYIKKPSDEDMDLAIKRWEMLSKCSYECNVMMRKLRYNN